MLSQLLSIARNTFVESVRQPIYFVIIALAGLLQIFTTWSSGFTMGLTESGEVSGDEKLMLDISLATVFVGGMLLAAFLATAVLSKEIENKTVLTVVSKPVGRPTVVLGKYLGAAGAILIAVVTMLMFLQMGLRHGVMSTASHEVDQPVVLFSCLAVLLSVGVAIWGNFFYGWSFTQAASLMLCPTMIVAVGLVFLIGKKWEFRGIEHIGEDFKPQIALVCLCVLIAHMVLTAIATAVSARLGQVMTLVVCSGVFIGGLVSNYMLGRRAINNDIVARVSEATAETAGQTPLNRNGDTYRVVFEEPPRIRLFAGTPFYYGRNPDGLGLENIGTIPSVSGSPESEQFAAKTGAPGVVVVASDSKGATIRRIGGEGEAVRRPPEKGDFIFVRPTRTNAAALGLWGIIPNIQFFWLVDAVSQNQKIPVSHVGQVAVYGLLQIGVFLSLGIALFQKREVG
ncbi:MAG: ABC transporter permease [Phycisphaerales bacterium]|nr:ABC transporter permease [Phycisphaerales bacterium]